MSISMDADKGGRSLNFIKRFFVIMHNKFHYLIVECLSFLFKSYCCSFYGCELFTYHKTVKKIANFGVRGCNHEACQFFLTH